MIMMPSGWPGRRRRSQAMQTSGTPQVQDSNDVSELEQAHESYPTPAFAGLAPFFVAVKVRDDLGVHRGAQFSQRQASWPRDVAGDQESYAVRHQLLMLGGLPAAC